MDVGGVLHINHQGTVRWEAALHVEANCVLQARRWPRDQHQCDVWLSLAGNAGHSLGLLNEPPHQVSG